jgi:AcrR family transcriptional regulator
MKREQQKEQTKKLLQQAAIELFQKQGYSKTTVSQITSQAGVAKGTFFNYFGSKEAVLHSLREQQTHYIEQVVENMIQQNTSIKEGLSDLFQKIALQHEEAGRLLVRSIFQVVLIDQSFHRYELLQSRKFKKQLMLLFDKGKKIKEFIPDFCSEQMALTVLHHFYGVLFYWCTNENSPALSHLIDQAMSLFIKGISTQK